MKGTGGGGGVIVSASLGRAMGMYVLGGVPLNGWRPQGGGRELHLATT